MQDTWKERDLPVLRAAVRRLDETGHVVRLHELVELTGLDEATVTRALKALDVDDPQYFRKMVRTGQGPIIAIGSPTGEARRAAGAWPTPEGMAERLMAILEQQMKDAPDEDTRGKIAKVRDFLLADGHAALVNGLGGLLGNAGWTALS